MSHARYIVGDVRTVLGTLTPGSIDCVITSPPYYRQRAYLPGDHPDKASEIGQEPTPGDYLDTLLVLMDDLWPVMSDDATFWVNLGDKHAGSGGSGGDYNPGGLRDGQPKLARVPSGNYSAGAAWSGVERTNGRRDRVQDQAAGILPADMGDHWRGDRDGWPLSQSVCWLPELFGASLAYGRNLLTGTPHRKWVTRPPVTWCKPNPSVGRITRTFRTATELWIYGGKHEGHYFDLDSVREPPTSDEQWATTKSDDAHAEIAGRRQRSERSATFQGKNDRKTVRACNPNGVPPKNWWVVATEPYPGAHYAVFPPSLVVRPVICGSPPGGVVLDPFAGSGSTLAVATGHGRDAIGVDLDARNAQLALDRVGPLLLTIDSPEEAVRSSAAT